jgi:hypothetical protein
MTNNKQQTAVNWFSNQAYELFEQYSEGNFDRIALNKLMLKATEQAKEMEKEQIIKAIYSNFIYHENRISTIGEQYYNETYGGGEQ